MAIKESIEKAVHDVGFLADDLLEANKQSSPLEHVVLMDLLEMTFKLKVKIEHLKDAIGGKS